MGRIHLSPSADRGWSASHELGLDAAGRDLPRVDLSLSRDGVLDDDEPLVTRTIEDLIREGAAAVFATSPGFSGPIRRLASRNPEVGFFVAGGSPSTSDPANVGYYSGLAEEARFIAGAVAGLVIEPGAAVGFVAPVPVASTYRAVNAFALGLARTNLGARVHVRWTRSLFNPPAEREAAELLLGPPLRAALLAYHQYSSTVQTIADEAGRPSIGYQWSPTEPTARTAITSIGWNWVGYYRAILEPVCAGVWTQGGQLRLPPRFVDWTGSLRDGTVSLAPLNSDLLASHPRKDEIQRLFSEEMSKFRRGEMTIASVFSGFVRDNHGTLRIQGRADPAVLYGSESRWFAENVVGSATP